ncbi:hypothetical protein YM80_003671 [Salmonella enterica subsp. salamae]|nr:hypothetical protein [Salmonella enterica subsp. salamae]
MTDKTPKKAAENLVNTQAALAKITDTARDSELKSKALPQADALKARFKAGSIPLQTDFGDLIDLANIGRKAVGGGEGQTGPAQGFTLSESGCLELKLNEKMGMTVDGNGVGLNNDAWIKIMCDLHDTRAYIKGDGIAAFFASRLKFAVGVDTIAYVYNRSGKYMLASKSDIMLDTQHPDEIFTIEDKASGSSAAVMIIWKGKHIHNVNMFSCKIISPYHGKGKAESVHFDIKWL